MKNKLTISNKKNSLFFDQSIFLIGGFVAGVLSLLTLVFLDIFLKFSVFDLNFSLILFLVLVEEIFKILILNFLIDCQKKSFIFLKAFSFGIGFTLFEQALISLNFQLKSENINHLLILGSIHIITSLLLLTGLTKINQSKIIAIVYFLLAIFIHLVYNLIVTTLHL